mmetsp:Transcript_30800/g.88481  ORF Transcript_30800/g.88481 Transcript_30800/m.88481 type:complete len:615 (+) Transcript_30800:88-1932(+)
MGASGGDERQRLTGVADTAAVSGAGILGLAAVLALASLFLPWWVGGSSVGKLANDAVTGSTVSLWDLQLDVGKQAPDGAGGTTLKIEKQDMTWSQLCDLAAKTEDGEPGACSQVTAIRAFVVLAAIFNLAGAGALMLARSVSPLLLLVGAVLSLLSGVWAVLGIAMGTMVSTSGLQGGGAICCLISVIVDALALSASFYAAGIAMPIDTPKLKSRLTRHERVQEQRDKDMDEAMEMQAKVNARRLGEDTEESQGRRAPVMLKKVLFYSQETGGDADAEGVPTDWLEKAFQEIDEDGSGSIEMSELVECLNLCGLHASVEAMGNIMKEIDKNMSGDIDIHEFVEFFRSIEELDRFQAKSEQRAQFAQVLCNCCFVTHIIVVSILLMTFINMKEEDDPDNYLIFKNMLLAFSMVLGFLLVFVICIPAVKLTLGAKMSAWERQYKEEINKRFKKKPTDDNDDQGPRQAAWSTGNAKADGLTQITVNAAVFGASYRVSKQNFFQPQPELEMGHGRFGNTLGSNNASTLRSNTGASATQSQSGVHKTADGGFERYKPEAYWEAAIKSKEAKAASSFSPMQVRDMDMPREQPQMPGSLALADEPRFPGGQTGTGFYHRDL